MGHEQSKPNVIWIFGDQLRGQSVGYMGDPNVCTPNIDRLAAEGVTFTSAVMGSPLCSPSRGSLLSGRYPSACVPGHEHRLPAGQPTVASVLRANGYRTAYFGKWHLDGFHEASGRAAMHVVPPDRRGDFEDWAAYENNNSQWDCWVHGGEGPTAFHERLPGYETDALTDLLVGYLHERAQDRESFFAVLSVQPPHDPYVAPSEWMRRHTPGGVELRPNVPAIPRIVERARRDLAGYHAMIENLDWNVGRIRDALDAGNLWRQTHVLVFSDHGDLHGSHGLFRKTAPWEEAIRVPFVIGGGVLGYHGTSGYWPVPINHVDVAPTTLGLCGFAAPAWMAGFDYAGYRLHDRPHPDEPDSAYLQIVVPTLHFDSVDRPWRGVVTRDGWKYVALEGQPWLMFNLNEDPYEQANLALDPRYRQERQRLQKRLAQWIAETGDHFTLPALLT